MAMLRSRLSFAMRIPSSATLIPSSSSQKDSAAVLVCNKGDLRRAIRNVPLGQPPRKSDSSIHSPMKMPDDGAGSSCGGPASPLVLPRRTGCFAAANEVLKLDDADDSAEQPPSAAPVQSESDAKLAAMLLRAAKSIGDQSLCLPAP